MLCDVDVSVESYLIAPQRTVTGFDFQGDVVGPCVGVTHCDRACACGLVGIARTVTQHQRTSAERDAARQGAVVTRQFDRAGAPLDDSAHTADGVGHCDGPGSVEDQLAVGVLDGHVAGPQSARATAVADVQMTGVDGGGARIGIGPRQDGGARARLREATRAADEVAHRDRVRTVHDHIRTTGHVHRTRAQGAVGTAVTDLQRALRDIDGAGVDAGCLASQLHQTSAGFGHRARIPQIGHHIQAHRG